MLAKGFCGELGAEELEEERKKKNGRKEDIRNKGKTEGKEIKKKSESGIGVYGQKQMGAQFSISPPTNKKQ